MTHCGAFNSLADHQEQIDESGVMCGVSRQALHEIMSGLRELREQVNRQAEDEALWFLLPKRLRDKIWAAYKPGQEITMTPSAEYLAVAKEVQDWIYVQLRELRKEVPS